MDKNMPLAYVHVLCIFASLLHWSCPLWICVLRHSKEKMRWDWHNQSRDVRTKKTRIKKVNLEKKIRDLSYLLISEQERSGSQGRSPLVWLPIKRHLVSSGHAFFLPILGKKTRVYEHFILTVGDVRQHFVQGNGLQKRYSSWIFKPLQYWTVL